VKELIHAALTFIESLGYWGILIGLMLEVIPSELVLSYGGYLVSQGRITLLGAIAFGTVGCVVQQIILYWIGRYGGRPFIEKYGKYLLLKKHYLDMAERWFQRYGAGMVFTARFIPVVRQAISIPAGLARMPLWRFMLYTTLGTIPWAILFVYLGRTLGSNWEQINDVAKPYVQPFIWGSILLTLLYIAVKLVRRGRGPNMSGVEGEKNTAHQLRFIGKEYKVLNSRHVQAGSSSQEFDHIVVGPNGVFHIDSKNWSGEIHFTDQGLERSKKGHTVDPTAQMYRHEFVLKELLRSHQLQADVVGIICFTHPDSKLIGKSPAFVTLKLDRLVHFIKTYKPKKPLSPQEVNSIVKLIQQHSQSSR
jgi:membrane protein DedA with SNARE-associated domain